MVDRTAVVHSVDMSAVPRARRLRLIAPVLSLLVLVGAFGNVAASEFPAGRTGYHSYTELTADVAAVAAAHPDIVERFSIGKSYQGRDIWAVKVSDNVTVDENEPEVLFDGGHHSDEHMGVEMTLKILHWLVDGYGKDPRITGAVDMHEIWIVFNMNPDGSEFDISGGRFHYWRKNRQPTPGTTSIGTDLNRNYGYRWGGGGRTSTNPQAITYRGTGPFSTPEDRAMRDFLASRVVNGRQQIRAAITFHESGRLVMWPYGYTLTDVPSDMTVQDHSALRAIGRTMAASNGYKPEQASDLYVSSGTTRDYLYGMYRVFSYTFEMSVVDYPDDSMIGPETGRNRNAILYLIDRSWCPYQVLGAAAMNARCGAFDDDLEVGRGWTVNPDGTDTAAANGRFVEADPAGTATRWGAKQLGGAASGTRVFVTGAAAGTTSMTNDLDGRSTIQSPAFTLAAAPGQKLTFGFVFAHDGQSTAEDSLRAFVVQADGTEVPVWTTLGGPTEVNGAWHTGIASLDPFAGQTVRLRFQAEDGGPDNLLEVELDDVRVTRPG